MRLRNKGKSNSSGTIIVTDFKKLNSKDFYQTFDDILKEAALFSHDGRLFINKSLECSDFIFDIFNTLSQETTDVLREYADKYGKLFCNVKTFDDWYAMKDTDENRTHAFAMLCVPIEMKRREILSKYLYGSTKCN